LPFALRQIASNCYRSPSARSHLRSAANEHTSIPHSRTWLADFFASGQSSGVPTALHDLSSTLSLLSSWWDACGVVPTVAPSPLLDPVVVDPGIAVYAVTCRFPPHRLFPSATQRSKRCLETTNPSGITVPPSSPPTSVPAFRSFNT